MSRLVADASVILRALLPGQDPDGEARAAITQTLAGHEELVAPDLLSYEIGQAAARLRADLATKNALVPRSAQVATLVRPSLELHRAALETAANESLSFYDASYVALARELGVKLWTEDRELLRKCPDVAIDTATLRGRHR